MIRIPAEIYMALEEQNTLIAADEGETLEIVGGPGSVPAAVEKADTEVGPPS